MPIQKTDRQAEVTRLPDLILLGAMKSGTTTLVEYLRRHPSVCLPTKEPGYFSRDGVYGRGPEWYAKLFGEVSADQICGEASTCYSRCLEYPEAAVRIARAVPHVRLIYIMRHPVDRAYSHYSHLMSERRVIENLPPISFEEALDAFPTIVDTSTYIRQIQVYLHWFDREQFLLLTLDDLKEDPRAVLDRAQRFLGLSPLDLVSNAPLHSNRVATPVSKHAARDSLRRLRQTPAGALLAWLAPQPVKDRVNRSLLQMFQKSPAAKRAVRELKAALQPLTPELRQRLLAEFAEPNRQLEEFLERRLPDWYV
jgi:hypothetical protein